MEKPAKKLAELEKELQEACAAYNQAKTEESYARNKATGALNNLNKVQKEINVAIEQMQASAPVDSDWRRDKVKHQSANA